MHTWRLASSLSTPKSMLILNFSHNHTEAFQQLWCWIITDYPSCPWLHWERILFLYSQTYYVKQCEQWLPFPVNVIRTRSFSKKSLEMFSLKVCISGDHKKNKIAKTLAVKPFCPVLFIRVQGINDICKKLSTSTLLTNWWQERQKSQQICKLCYWQARYVKHPVTYPYIYAV